MDGMETRAEMLGTFKRWEAEISHLWNTEREDHEKCGEKCAFRESDDWEYFANHILEMEAEYRGGVGEIPDLHAVRIVFGTGGPHIELYVRGWGDPIWRGYWGGESVEVPAGGEMAEFGRYLFEEAEEFRPEGMREGGR